LTSGVVGWLHRLMLATLFSHLDHDRCSPWI
jgi:hypothetical protein